MSGLTFELVLSWVMINTVYIICYIILIFYIIVVNAFLTSCVIKKSSLNIIMRPSYLLFFII